MAEACVICPHVRNSEGEMVESRLFNDLLHYSSNNRELAKEFYAVGTSEKFLSKVGDKAKFDENGEITFSSLKELAKIDIKEEQILSTLNRDIGAGVHDYNDAIAKVQDFNRSSPMKSKYMATISLTDKGKYNLSVVPRNSKNLGKLTQEIANRTLQDQVLYYLREAGVDVEFIENDERTFGRYSTQNAKQTANGLYQLIQIANGSTASESMAEEAGHFAVGALGKSPLVQRLQAMLTPEVQQRIYGDEYEDKVKGPNSTRETAGYLVGRALINRLERGTPGRSLIDRVVRMAKSIFATIKGDKIQKAILEADEIARSIAEDFTSQEFSGTVEQALETKETLYSKIESNTIKAFKEVVQQLELQSEEIASIDERLRKKFDSIVLEAAAGRDVSSGTVFADLTALDGITSALESLVQLLPEMIDTLTEIDFTSDVDFYTNMAKNSKALRVVQSYLKNATTIIELVNKWTSGISKKDNITLRDIEEITKFTKELQGVLSGNAAHPNLLTSWEQKRAEYILRFMEEQYGKEYVHRAARKIWNKEAKGIKGLLINVEAKDVPLSDILDHLDEDISWMASVMGSASNADIFTQIADKTAKAANKIADDLTLLHYEQINSIRDRFKKLGYKESDMLKFYEVMPYSRGGKLSGYFISDRHWGMWKQDFEDMRRAAFEDFKRLNPNIHDTTVSQIEKDVLWEAYFKPIRKAWHKANSKFNPMEERWEPNDTFYHNEDYDTLVAKDPQLVDILNEIMELKRELDSKLPEGATINLRAPQFRSNFVMELRNRRLRENGVKAFGKTAFRRGILDTFGITADDRDFGSDLDYNTPEEDLFPTPLSQEKEKLHRVPTFGLRMLDNMDQLSTDIFHSMISYSSMANTFAAMSTIADSLELGRSVLDDRTVEGMTKEKDRKVEKSRAFTRYGKLMEKQVYGIGYRKINTKLEKVLAKTASSLNGLAAKLFLGGNVHGGLVNLGTGGIEIFKEAMAGQYYSLRDWRKAHGQYMKSLPSNLWNTGKDVKTDKVSLIIDKFNVLGENKRKFKDMHTTDSRIYNFFGESLMLPYKAGDHYMQTISYLAIMNGTFVYDSNGNRISLWDAYTTEDVDPNNSKLGKKLSIKDGVVFKDKDSIPTYHLINNIISEIDNVLAGAPSMNLSQEEQDYLNDNNYSDEDLFALRSKLSDDANNLTWNSLDESKFMDKAREINNRLHGIYNSQDKTAWHQNVFTNMVLSMKGYALGMIERRFGQSKYSVALDEESEGSLNTVAKVIASTFTDSGGFFKTMQAIFLPVVLGKSTKAMMQAQGFSDTQYYNMRRNFGDMLFILALYILRSLTNPKRWKEDDDEEDVEPSVANGLIYYFSSRLFWEQSAFNIPNTSGILREWNSLADLLPAGVSAVTALYDLADLYIGEQFADEDDSKYFYQSNSRDGLYEKGDSKAERKFTRMFPYLRSTYVLSNPYGAIESYEYGQRVKMR